MKSFSDICKDFFSTNNCNDLLGQLQTLDKIGHETIGDYHAVGCEIILNGMNTGNKHFNLAEMMESYFDYDNVMRHWFNFINDWDTFLFYSPSYSTKYINCLLIGQFHNICSFYFLSFGICSRLSISS